MLLVLSRMSLLFVLSSRTEHSRCRRRSCGGGCGCEAPYADADVVEDAVGDDTAVSVDDDVDDDVAVEGCKEFMIASVCSLLSGIRWSLLSDGACHLIYAILMELAGRH